MNNTVTIDRLKEQLTFVPKGGYFVWNQSKGRVKAGEIAGTLRPDGYIKINIDCVPYMAHRLIWFMVYGEFPDCEIDHINGIRNDNRLENLRLATSKQNKENARLKINNTSGHRGVSWDASRNKWLAFVVSDRKFHNIGRFDDIGDAVIAVREARNKLFTHHLTSYSA